MEEEAELTALGYDRRLIQPGIVHLGVGNFHRSHQARYLDRLLRRGQAFDWGIIGVGLLARDAAMRDALLAQDCEYTLLERSPAGEETAIRIGSIIDYRYAPDSPEAVLAALADPRIKIVTLTITEGGYSVLEGTGEFDATSESIAHDLLNPGAPRTALGYLVAALARRRAAGTRPFTVLSCDNIQGNGEVARRALTGFAALLDAELSDWIADNVAFPNSMVDRITPVTTDDDRAHVATVYGVTDAWPVVCESFSQWVIEDRFPAGRPAFEEVGAELTHDVAPYERMKLRLLNGAHQALGHLGLPAGLKFVHEAIEDDEIADYLSRYLGEEAIPAVPPIPGVDLTRYCASVLERFGNRQIQDTLERIVVDASDRVAKFVLPTVSDAIARGRRATLGAVVVACWAIRLDRDGVDAVPDRQAPLLHQAVSRQRESGDGFVADPVLFGTLAADPLFRSDFARAYALLQAAPNFRAGLRAALTEDGSPP